MALPGVTTLGTMRTTAQQEADLVNSSFISTAEWNSYLNASYQELYSLLIQKYGENYYTALDTTNKPYQFTTDGTNEYFKLPDGSGSFLMPDGITTAPAFFKLNGVDLWLSSSQTVPSQWFTLHRFTMGERNKWTLPNAIAPYGYIALRYRLEANRLWLRPLPQTGQLIQVRYAPRLTLLANDSDTADLVSGWEELIIVDTVIKALMKEESDVTAHMMRKADLVKQIEAAADNRDPGEPQTVVDVQSGGFFGGFAGGSGGLW